MSDQKNHKVLGKYRVLKTLGTGIFKVKLVYDPTTGKQYAAKISKYSLRKAALEKESNILQELNKTDIPNLIKGIEFIDNCDGFLKKNSYQLDCNTFQTAPDYNFKAALIMEYAPNETIFDIIFFNGKLEEKLARTYFKQLIETVAALHSKGFVHRDLKPENILLDENFQLKLADFGFAKEFTESNKDRMNTKLGTETYMAPEMHSNRTYSGVKTDSFSCGVLLFLFMFGRPPFFKASTSDPFYKNFTQENPDKFWSVYEEKLNQGKEFDKNLKTLLNDLLKHNPDQRLEAQNVLDYEWMKGEVYTNDELIEIITPLREEAKKASQKKRK